MFVICLPLSETNSLTTLQSTGDGCVWRAAAFKRYTHLFRTAGQIAFVLLKKKIKKKLAKPFGTVLACSRVSKARVREVTTYTVKKREKKVGENTGTWVRV